MKHHLSVNDGQLRAEFITKVCHLLVLIARRLGTVLQKILHHCMKNTGSDPFMQRGSHPSAPSRNTEPTLDFYVNKI